MELKSNKLQAKDLINVGIFTAIYFVIFFAGMMLGYIPIFIPLLGLVCPILCGIPFMLYLTKVKKFGMVSLTGIILGLLNLIMGSGVLVLIFGNGYDHSPYDKNQNQQNCQCTCTQTHHFTTSYLLLFPAHPLAQYLLIHYFHLLYLLLLFSFGNLLSFLSYSI